MSLDARIAEYMALLSTTAGSFTNDAKVGAGHAHEPVTILDGDGFIKLALEHYETMEPEFQSKVPSRRVWVPTE